MVKRQKEKQYESAAEHRLNSQIRSGSSKSGGGTTRRLPFNCCALTLTPYTNPVCTPNNGIIFETSAILPYLLKHKKDPVSGNPMTSKDLITLQMDKDEEGRWQCPVLCKPFSDHTKIVGIRQNPPGNEANVYSFDAVQELNLKPKNYEDLTSGKRFHRINDIIVLQDPADPEHNKLRDINNFKHMSLLRDEKREAMMTTGNNSSDRDIRHSVTAVRIMDKLKRKREEDKQKQEKESKAKLSKSREGPKGEKEKSDAECDSSSKLKIFTDDLTGVQMTSGKASGSFTSTVMSVKNDNQTREATQEEILQSQFEAMKRLKKKGFVRLTTNMGSMDLELHCDIAPRTCTNFIGLVEKGKYNGTVFHRSIRNFMIQGGKPSKAGEVEESLWGCSFEDEYDDRLTHFGAGVVSMANAGPGTNRQQFFITYKSAPHLDRKHSIFGRVASGIKVLQDMEGVSTDKKDRPKKEIKIIRADVFLNPVLEAKEKERVRIQQRIEKRQKEKESRKVSLSVSKATNDSSSVEKDDTLSEKTPGLTIGKYLPKSTLKGMDFHKKNKLQPPKGSHGTTASPLKSRMPPPPKKTKFGDFSGW